jgi:predicted small metal-binding protein
VKELACGDIVPGCSATFEAETEDEIMAAAADHAREEHGMTEIPSEVAEQIRAKIRDAA